jgi:hypothetical protein
VQETCLENKEKHVQEDPTKKPSNFPQKNFKKFKRKEKKTAIVKREGGKPSCTHWKKGGDDEEHCWKLHTEKKPKQFGGEGRQRSLLQCKKILVPIQEKKETSQWLEYKVKYSLHASSSSNDESHVYE